MENWRGSVLSRRRRETIKRIAIYCQNSPVNDTEQPKGFNLTATLFVRSFQADILEETIRYIDSLHQKLLARVHADGLPARLTHQAAAASGKKATI